MWFSFCLGTSIRACLIDQPQLPHLFLGQTLSMFIEGFETSMPLTIVLIGLVIGWLTPVRFSKGFGAFVAFVAFAGGYISTSGICAVIGI